MANLFEGSLGGIGHGKFRHLVKVMTIERNQIEAVEKLNCEVSAFVVGACVLRCLGFAHVLNL
jgi:hypothetical protein